MGEAKKAFGVLKKQIEKLKKDYQKAGKAAFAEESKLLFDKHPKMKKFSWTQYTPYFNDGEPCRFSAHTDYPIINEELDYWYGDEEVKEGLTKAEFDAACKDVVEFLSAFDDDILEGLFGDHVRVVVTKKGAKAEEYYHD